jgi:hypothetical protein
MQYMAQKLMERCGTSTWNATRCNPTKSHSPYATASWKHWSSKVSVMKVLALDTHYDMGLSWHVLAARFIYHIVRSCLLVWVFWCGCDGQNPSPIVAHHEELEVEVPPRNLQYREDDLVAFMHGLRICIISMYIM